MQSWKGCICMVQIPLSGKYTWVFKEKRNKPTHMAHLNFKVFFCCWGCLPCWSSGFKHHPLVFNQELIYPHLWSSLRLFHPTPSAAAFICTWSHWRSPSAGSGTCFHFSCGSGRWKEQNGRTTHMQAHAQRENGAGHTLQHIFSGLFRKCSEWEPCQSTVVLLVPRVSTIFVFFSVHQFALVTFAFWKLTCTSTIPEMPHDKRCGLWAEP